ncbi:hypothetical protein CAOG_03662 [Capsaspora owczarzaki ATCC 30864]|uniref:ADF-H domain-containing protein n=1 Tax=Capsaspora owczarzaki (strain ATCC 30864) TaxID=595528 RepID=A0A0D2UCJ5_CAPO3|nr:hypothetical protein CAOG_03662 [Capsaspora owczarzaki ATCC 30864]KJE92756.1 hypothetical protein CAOG_003662 [Capsaspora owczarzaki ATCC 30864]|eukprot:XP_004363390.1 hypothetical protein CAOG_03662 [Capsaspora owczarzaki ATCC 30864]
MSFVKQGALTPRKSTEGPTTSSPTAAAAAAAAATSTPTTTPAPSTATTSTTNAAAAAGGAGAAAPAAATQSPRPAVTKIGSFSTINSGATTTAATATATATATTPKQAPNATAATAASTPTAAAADAAKSSDPPSNAATVSLDAAAAPTTPGKAKWQPKPVAAASSPATATAATTTTTATTSGSTAAGAGAAKPTTDAKQDVKPVAASDAKPADAAPSAVKSDVKAQWQNRSASPAATAKPPSPAAATPKTESAGADATPAADSAAAAQQTADAAPKSNVKAQWQAKSSTPASPAPAAAPTPDATSGKAAAAAAATDSSATAAPKAGVKGRWQPAGAPAAAATTAAAAASAATAAPTPSSPSPPPTTTAASASPAAAIASTMNAAARGSSGLASGVAGSSSFESNIAKLKGAKRIIKVQIVNDAFSDTASVAPTAGKDWREDLGKLPALADEEQACYFFVKEEVGKWLLVTWIPEAKVKVKERMLYASSADGVKKAFGFDSVFEEMHATSKEDLSLKHYQDMRKAERDDLLSPAEKAQKEAHAMEEVARKEMAASQGAGSRQLSLADLMKSSDTRIETPSNAKGIGGYHAVQVPFSDPARERLELLVAGDENVNWLVLALSSDQKSIVLESFAGVPASGLSALVVKDEPRFYIYRLKSGGDIAFLYVCPSSSQPRQRMVYSTSKASVTQTLNQVGIEPKKIESSDPSEISDQFIRDEIELAARAVSTSHARTSSPAAPDTIKAQHPVYGLMGASAGGTTTKKKIVMPPAHAYG